MKPSLILKRINVYKSWEPNSDPISIIYRPQAKYIELASSLVKILNLKDIMPQNLVISAANPSIEIIDFTKTLQDQEITPSSKLYVNFKSNQNPAVEEGLKPSEPVSNTKPAHCTLLTKYIEKDSKNLMPPEYDITQKVIILYGIAASFFFYYEAENVEEDDIDIKAEKYDITTTSIYIDDDKMEPFIDYDKAKIESQNQNQNMNDKYKQYLAPELLIKKSSIEPGQPEVFMFGSLFYSIMTKTVVKDKQTDFSTSSQIFDDLIKRCHNNDPTSRVAFCDILMILSSKNFIDSLQQFDADRFKEYKKKVVGAVFDSEISSHYDVKKIPGIKIFQRSDFEMGKSIGSGMSGVVYLATDKSNGQKVAFKELKLDNFVGEEEIAKQIHRNFREIEILASTDHFAIQKLYGYIEGEEEQNIDPVILTPYEANGSLEKLIKEPPKNFDFTQKFIVMYGIAAGMYHLHKKNIIHRDMKPENILINENFEPQITDFGLSKISQSYSMFQSNTNTGTPVYMAPELFDNEDSSFVLLDARLSDVYAFGLVLVYLFTGEKPFKSIKMQFTLICKVLKGERPTLPSDFPKMLRLLIEACWDGDPSERPTFENIIHIIGSHTFLDSFGDNLNIDRFREYQNKVINDESNLSLTASLSKSLNSIKSKVLINHVKFPSIPEEKTSLIHDFKILSVDENSNHFFAISEAELVRKPGSRYRIIKLKDEYIEEKDILSCFSSVIELLLKVDHPAINPLFSCTNLPIHGFSQIESIYDYFPREVNKPPEIILQSFTDLSKNKRSLSITEKFIILYGIAAGMYYMHSKNYVHLNLKPENILLNNKKEPVIDLDITSRPAAINENLFYLLPALSYSYVSPELLNFDEGKSKNENPKSSDVYSFGMIAYKVMTSMDPYGTNRSLQSALFKATRGKKPKTEGIIPSPFDQLIKDCWQTNPLIRPTFKTILERMSSLNFVKSIKHIEIRKFQNYQKKVVDKEFIVPLRLFNFRRRDEFEIKKLIGSGMCGNVKLAIDKRNGNKIAYKEIPSSQEDFIEREKEILTSMNYPSIISLYGLIEPNEENKESVVLLPYAPNGDLEKMLQNELKKKNQLPKGWDYTQRCIVLYGIAMGMFKLHEKNIIHRDLKPQNILLDNNLEPWITDFELSKFVDPNQSLFQSMTVGTPYYMSPEVLNESQAAGDEEEEEEINERKKIDENEKPKKKKGFKYDGKLSDVYSFGILVFYLMTGIQPWANIKSQFNLIKKVIDGIRPTIPDNLEQPVVELITNCWNASPDLRPTFKEIVDIVSNPEFYKSPRHQFDKKRFYEYQIKLGDVDMIKFSDEEIKKFQEEGNNDNVEPEETVPDSQYDENISQVIHEMADKGDAEFQYIYGCMLFEGTEIEQNLKEAVRYYKLSSDQGYTDGSIAYAGCLKEGTGVDKNEKAAIEVLKEIVKKTNEKNSDVLIELANLYCEIRPRKYLLAYDLYKKAFKLGNADAAGYIGSLIEKKKIGSIMNQDDIFKYYKKSCDDGSTIGMYHMATLYHYGIGVDKDLQEAIRLYNITAKVPNQNQQASVFSLSILYEENNDYANAYHFVELHRESEMFIGYVRCSDFLQRGLGVEKDEQKAKEYMEIACQPKYADDQLALALLYSRAKGVTKDNDQRFRWTLISANNGNSVAQANLSGFYIHGIGCEPDIDKSLEWAMKSAEAGNDHGMWAVARAYRKKKDDKKTKIGDKKKIKKDKEIKEFEDKELEYLKKSAQVGYEKALTDLGSKYKDMKNFKEAALCFKEAAEDRIPLGLFCYGEYLLTGEYVPTKDVDAGVKMIEDAAEMGLQKAVEKMIDIYSNGLEGIKKDDKKAQKYKDILKKIDKPRKKKSSV